MDKENEKGGKHPAARRQNDWEESGAQSANNEGEGGDEASKSKSVSFTEPCLSSVPRKHNHSLTHSLAHKAHDELSNTQGQNN